MTLTLKDRIEGGLVGLLIGDALGVPYEFHVPDDIPPLADIEMVPPPGFARSHAGTPPYPEGTQWSDDGAQALALLASLLERGEFDPHDLARRLVAWQDEGYMAAGARERAGARLRCGQPDAGGAHGSPAGRPAAGSGTERGRGQRQRLPDARPAPGALAPGG